MPATQLGIYNDALRAIGERKLASLTENTEPRRVLDDHWNRSGVTMGAAIYCLERAPWNFATRSSALAASTSVEPPFGFPSAFNKPTDWLRTVAVCDDPSFKSPLADTGYADEASFWFANVETLYVKYVSSDSAYGLSLALWPMSFVDFVVMYMAKSVVSRLAPSRKDEIEKQWMSALKSAQGIDGSNKPTSTQPLGSWAGARLAGRSSENG